MSFQEMASMARLYALRTLLVTRELTKWLLSAFCPTILGGGRNLRMLFYHSITAGSVVGILRGDWDTQTPP